MLKLPFLEEFITPIVKASKGKEELSFYSLPEFEEWKDATTNWNKYKIKYYKGLGTSTSKEAKEYFLNMKRHRILFKYEDNNDDEHIEMVINNNKNVINFFHHTHVNTIFRRLVKSVWINVKNG